MPAALPPSDILPTAARRRIGLRLLKVAAWLAAAWVLLMGLGRYALPPLARSQAQKIAFEELGRKVTIGAVTFTPWTLELTVRDIVVRGADGQSEQLRIDRAYADVELQSLLRLAPVVDALRIERPRLTLARLGPGRWDIDDILDRLSRATERAPASKEPARFALHNIELVDGAADFADRPLGKTHRLRELHLALPFLSTLEAHRDVRVEPKLAFTLDGSRFESSAVATPFRSDGRGEAKLALQGLDLAPYAGHLPATLPVRLRSAVFGADLTVAFERTPRASLRIAGRVEAKDIALTDAHTAQPLDIGRVALHIADLRPLEQRAALARIEVDAPRLQIGRDRTGALLLPFAARPGNDAASKSAAKATPPGPTAAGASGWTVEVAELALRQGRVALHDESTAPAAALALHDLTLDASSLRWPLAATAPFKGAATLGPADAASGGAAPARLAFSGRAGEHEASVALSVSALSLALGRPYLRARVEPALSGTLDAELAADWRAAAAARPGALVVKASRLRLSELALAAADVVPAPAPTTKPAAPRSVRGVGSRTTMARTPAAATVARAVPAPAPASIGALELADASIDLGARRVGVGRLALRQPRLALERDADRRWNVERWLAASAAPAASGAPPPARPPPAVAPTAAAPWQVAIAELAVEGGELRFRDRAASRPVAIDFVAVDLKASGVALDAAKASPVQFSARVSQPAGGGAAPTATAANDSAGRIDFRGSVGPFAGGVPSAARGALQASNLPLAALEPYFGSAVNLDIERAQASLRGDVAWAAAAGGPRLEVKGDASLDDFRARSVAVGAAAGASAAAAPQRSGLRLRRDDERASTGAPLLNWKSLAVRGLEVALAPGQPLRVATRDNTLTDFFARVVVDEQGRINLQDLARPRDAPPGAAAAADAAAAAAQTSPPARGTTVRTAQLPVPAPADAAGAPLIRLGPTAFVSGRVQFTDRFIRPNYSANLTELNGRLGGFSSTPPAAGAAPQLAELTLRGRAEGTASLEIDGRVNPLAKPLALDVKARVRDLELPPLSPYAIKYAGYGIERGKLSVDVSYLVLPNGQLTASNKIVLNQLAFGDKVEGAPTSLPVKLAVALLADRDGVIDLDLPVSGSINDPQFSIGGLIWRALGNLIVKAVTAPFQLLASAVGGGADGGGEMSQVEFAPGSAVLTAPQRETLDRVAKALAERPRLKMTVVGTSHAEAEREAWKRERLRQLVHAEKRRALGGGRGGSDTPADAVTVGDAEYPALLHEVYRRAELPGKPRNLIGMAKTLPVAESEALLLAAMTVGDDAMQQLAVRRGVAVRDYLVGRRLPTERLFLGAARTVTADGPWTPHAELKLSMD